MYRIFYRQDLQNLIYKVYEKRADETMNNLDIFSMKFPIFLFSCWDAVNLFTLNQMMIKYGDMSYIFLMYTERISLKDSQIWTFLNKCKLDVIRLRAVDGYASDITR